MSAALDLLASAPCGYHPQQPPAAEPTALAALALIGAGRLDAAQKHLHWLAAAQTAGGDIAPFGQIPQSAWPTPIAIIAAVASDRKIQAESNTASGKQSDSPTFSVKQASTWLLSAAGLPVPKSPNYGHNTQLIGWPWVLGTHSWQEPTAWSVLALQSLGLGQHPRAQEGIRLLVDRLLATGGCNYGNTIILGQTLRPHVLPTGLALLALAGEQIADPRIEKSIQYLTDTLNADTTSVSLSYGLLGLTAHNRRPAESQRWLEAAYRRTEQRDPSPHALALLVLAGQGVKCPIIQFTKTPEG
jgi:hypothetical protein